MRNRTWNEIRTEQIRKRKALDDLSNLQVLMLAFNKVILIGLGSFSLIIAMLVIAEWCLRG